MINEVKIPKTEQKPIIWLASPIDILKVWVISIRRTLTIRLVAWGALLLRAKEKTLKRLFTFRFKLFHHCVGRITA